MELFAAAVSLVLGLSVAYLPEKAPGEGRKVRLLIGLVLPVVVGLVLLAVLGPPRNVMLTSVADAPSQISGAVLQGVEATVRALLGAMLALASYALGLGLGFGAQRVMAK